MKKIILAFILGILTFNLVGCSNNKSSWQDEKYEKTIDVTGAKLVNEGKLTVALSPDYAPYEFLDLTKSGIAQFNGSDVYFASYLAQNFGLELDIIQMSFDNLFATLTTNKADIVISGLTYSSERAENYGLTKSYYDDGEGGQVLICSKEDVDKFKTLDDLNKSNIKISAQNNSLQMDLVKEFLPSAQIDLIQSIPDGLTKIKQDKVDALAISELAALTVVEENSDFVIIPNVSFPTEESGLIACVSKSNTVLLEKVNLAISNLAENQYYTWFEVSKALANEPSIDSSSNFFTITIKLVKNYGLQFLEGIGITLSLSLISVLFGTIIAIFITFLKRNSFKPLNALATVYVEFIRGIPLLLLLWFIYLAAPSNWPPFISVAVALFLNSAAYVSEIIRAGINAVPKGQFEAASCLGLTKFQTMHKIIIPQALKNILPALGNEFVMLIKETSLASVFFVGDLMTIKNNITSLTYLSLEPFVIVGAIYFVLTFSISKLVKHFEERMSA